MTTTDAQLAVLFDQDTDKHLLTVLHDQGHYRHLRWAAPGTGINAVEISTIPGTLFVTGDMGSFTFHRHGTSDLLTSGFFNRGANYGYWASKCEAADTRVGLREFSAGVLKATVESYISDWADDIDDPAALREEAEYILYADCVEDAYSRLAEFNHNGLHFDDIDESSVTEFTVQFRWICRALMRVGAEYTAGPNAQMESAA